MSLRPPALAGSTLLVALAAILAGCGSADDAAAPTDAPAGEEAPSRAAGFIDLADIEPEIRQDIRYAGRDNFVGAPIDGYEAPACLLTRPAAAALGMVQADLAPYGLALKVYDCYRPQRAVDHFVRWAADPGDVARKADYYPDVPKHELFERGYVAERSGHSRGSTVDLTLVDAASGAALDMGGPWDFFDPSSWPDSAEPPAEARAARLALREAMTRRGFRPYEQEWWHFTLADEPYPDSYFDFPVTRQ